ncbi:DNA polymerase III subunit delta' [bacterium]|nr:DNA polymerase III subunit delta' [bacterium]
MPFSEIKGQPRAIEYFKRSVRNKRLGHAFLFIGPEGVGKRATALALAQALNCSKPAQGEACGECPACRKITQNGHPDVRIIEPEGQFLKIDQIREQLQRDAILKPMEGSIKLYILDSAEKLTLEAANSLLKLLEEPPPAVILVLITIQPFVLLETIRSRCQTVRFQPLETKVLSAWLRERLNCQADQAQALAMQSGGRPAKALRLADENMQALRNRVLGMLQQLGPNDWAEVAVQWGEQRVELPEMLAILLSWFRDLIILSNRASHELIMNSDRLTELEAALLGESPESLGEKCQAVLTAIHQIKKNINTQLLLEVLFMKIGARAGRN